MSHGHHSFLFCFGVVFASSEMDHKKSKKMGGWRNFLWPITVWKMMFLMQPLEGIFLKMCLIGAMSPHTHARANEDKLEKVGPSFSSSVGDFGRLFLSV